MMLAACMSPKALDSEYLEPPRVAELESRIERDSSDAVALRHLGAHYLQMKQFDEAGPLLRQAYVQDSKDPVLWYYYGLYLENADSLDEAARLYAGFRELSRHSRERRLRSLLAGRYEAALRAKFRKELIDPLESIPGISSDPDVLLNTVAVFPLQFDGEDERYEPLGRGLSSLIMIDLARVAELTVVERLRMQVLLDELNLTEAGIIDPGTAPRVGQLLRARRLIGGRYAVVGDERVRFELAMREVIDDDIETLPAEDALNRFYELEKDIVFGLIDEMGIELSEAERRQIEYIPTRDLQAFLAYSRGLQAEDAGHFGEAVEYFRAARREDRGFSEAAERAEVNEGLQDGGATSDEAVERAGARAIKDVLLRTRHRSLGGNVGSLLVPGQDTRDPISGTRTDGVIGIPPAPPASGSN